ncbi:unnamed protein product, partial [Owenia fusiformis]
KMKQLKLVWMLATLISEFFTYAKSTDTKVELHPRNLPGWLLNVDENNEVRLVKKKTNDDSGLWTVQSPGLTLQPNTVSIQYNAKPGYFLRRNSGKLYIQSSGSDSSFEGGSTWLMLKDEYFPRTFVFQSTHSDKRIMHYTSTDAQELKIAGDDGTDGFKNAASFYQVPWGDPIHSIGGPVQDYGTPPLLGKLNILADLTFQAHGEVLVWEYFAENTYKFWADIWRPLVDGGFKLIGKNEITPPGTGLQSYVVPFGQTVMFQPGDVIGAHTSNEKNLALIYKGRSGTSGLHEKTYSQFTALGKFDYDLPVGAAVTGPKSCCRLMPIMAYSQQVTPITFNIKHGEGSLISMKKDKITDGNLNTCININIGTSLKFDEDISGVDYSEYNIVLYTQGLSSCVSNKTIIVYQETTGSSEDFTGSFKICDFLDSKVVETYNGLVTGCKWSCSCEANVCKKGYVAIVAKSILCDIYINY